MRLGIVDGAPIYPETRFGHTAMLLDREALLLADVGDQTTIVFEGFLEHYAELETNRVEEQK